MPRELEFRILGPLDVVRAGRSLALGGPKQRALLALMLLNPDRLVTRDAAVAALWPDPPKTADKIVRIYASRLQKLLGADAFENVRPGYVLHVPGESLDATHFEELVESARNAQPAEAVALFAEALALWRGRALDDVADEDFGRAEAARLEQARLAALEDSFAAELSAGRAARVVGALESFVAAEPLRERAWELLMLALYRSGRQAQALEEYRRARAMLVGELGVEPGAGLKRLERAILRQDPSLEATPAAGSAFAVPTTPFLGRELELERVASLLRRPDVRLLTLTGTGGIGKTRLAVEVSRRVSLDFPDGIHVVSLGSIADPSLVLPAIAQALGVVPLGGAVEPALRLHLRDRVLLLVLDSFEHVVAAATELPDLLASAPGLKVLVTSTAVLRLSSEREFVVPPLDAPDRTLDHDVDALLAVPSVALFVRRAEAVNAAFALDASSAPIVAEICRRLEGLPLAIELAAARTKLFPAEAMLKRLGDRLELLAGGVSDGPARHKTLRATIDWSYRLLDTDEQRLFAQLGVFAGGCTLDAVAAICGDGDVPLDGLASLVDKSLLRSIGEEPRFSMLDTLREYALERAREDDGADRLRRRHAEYFVALAEQGEPELTGAHQAQWYERLEAEHDNFRAALSYAIGAHEAGLALRLGAALTRFWQVRGHAREGRRWLLDVLALNGDQPPRLRAKALARACILSLRQGRDVEARPLLEESLELYRKERDPAGSALAMLLLGHVTSGEGDAAGSLPIFQSAVEAYRELGDLRGVAVALNDVGCVRLVLGDWEGAVADCEEAAALSAEVGDRQALSAHLLNIVFALLELGREDEAVAKLEETFTIARELGYKDEFAYGLEAYATLAARRGDLGRAARLLGAAESVRESLGTVLESFELEIHDRVVAEVGRALGERGLATAWAQGRALDVEDAVEYALSGSQPALTTQIT